MHNHKLKKPWSRRDVLKASAAAAACAAIPSALQRAGAQQAAPLAPAANKLIIVLASGGWDQSYVLDPKLGASGVDAPEGSVQMFGNLPIMVHPSRPAVTSFFTRFAERACVINGLQVRSFVHPDCMKRVLTGSPSETTPDMGAIAAFERGRELPVPYLALGGQARSGQYAAVTGRTGTTNQLAALVDEAAAYPSIGGFVPEVGLSPSDDERAFVRSYLDASTARLAATRGQTGYNKRRVEDFAASLDRAERLRAFARENGAGERDYTLDLGVQIPLAVRALEQGLSCAALMQTNNWDTHENNARQGTLHEGLFGALGLLVDTLESRALLDDTLVLVLSEMGRAPKLNADNGKDHWPVTSAMLLGAGVRGGQALGGTSDELDALALDLATGLPSEGGEQLQAGHLVAGVLETLGVDTHAYLPEVEPFRAFRIS
jgi:uncharacterized protein (DUF1501 family)